MNGRWKSGKLWLAKLQKHPGMYHLLVAEIDGSVVGFAYNNEFREKLAYQTSTEVTIYLKPDMSVKGLGSALLSHLISDMKKSAFRRAYSLITLPNQVSEALHRKFGFVQVGQMTEVGFKFGQFHDVAIYELPLHSGNTPKG